MSQTFIFQTAHIVLILFPFLCCEKKTSQIHFCKLSRGPAVNLVNLESTVFVVYTGAITMCCSWILACSVSSSIWRTQVNGATH